MKKQLLAALLCAPLLTQAQDAYTLKFLPELQQSQWVNASNRPDAKINIGIPVLSGIGFYYYNSGFTYNSLFHRSGDNMSINPGDFIDKLKDRNLLGVGANVQWLSCNVALPMDLNVGFSVQDRADFRFSYPKDLFKFAWYGNGAYIGQTLDIGKFGLSGSWYREYALHATKAVGKWTFGVSPKLLFGKTNVNTKASSLKITTEPDYYVITAEANMQIQTSGFADSADRANGAMEFPGYAFNTKNAGLGIDLGASYQLDDKITLSGGINNLGYIKWKSNVHNYSSGPTKFTFDGFGLENFLRGDSNFISTDQYLDSVKDLIDFKKSTDPYKTALPAEFFVMGNYQMGRISNFGAQLSMQRFVKKSVFAATLAYRAHVSKHFTGAITYTAKSNAAFNLGGAIIARYAGMQIYFATDNWFASIKPLNSKNTNFHMGLNLAIGDRVKKKNEVDEYHFHHEFHHKHLEEDEHDEDNDNDEEDHTDHRPDNGPTNTPPNR